MNFFFKDLTPEQNESIKANLNEGRTELVITLLHRWLNIYKEHAECLVNLLGVKE